MLWLIIMSCSSNKVDHFSMSCNDDLPNGAVLNDAHLLADSQCLCFQLLRLSGEFCCHGNHRLFLTIHLKRIHI